MKITIEPTTEYGTAGEHPNHTVSVSLPHDDLTVPQMLQLFRLALLAMTYSPCCVDDAIPVED